MSLAQGAYLLFLALGCMNLGIGGGPRKPSEPVVLYAPSPRLPSVAELEAQTRPADRPRAAPRPTVREADISWSGPDSGPLLWPVQAGRLALRFGTMEGGVHTGLDLHAPLGAPIRAAATGQVAFVGLRGDAYGNLVIIDHKGGWQTAYAHNDVNLVRTGQRIFAGHVVGRVGATGHAGTTGTPTLHFEVRKGGEPQNPLRFFDLPAAPPPPPADSPEGPEADAISLLLP